MAGVLEASTLPAVLLGGEVGGDQEGAYERWRKALRLPTVQGMVVGRSLLYPAEGSVEIRGGHRGRPALTPTARADSPPPEGAL